MLRHFKMQMLKSQRLEEQNDLVAAGATLASTTCSASGATMPTNLVVDKQQSSLAPLLLISASDAPQPLQAQQHHHHHQHHQQQQQQNHKQQKQQHKALLSTPSTVRAAPLIGTNQSEIHKSDNKVRAARAQASRSRRASKPQMEKRRRARINECLDALKSYVLTDSTNLIHLGIDPAASENQDEETIARTILKSSGLIYRHKGRKNPNKLEKADILELTVDYVRRLHEQRSQLLNNLASSMGEQSSVMNLAPSKRQLDIPAHLGEPLTLDLSPKSRSAEPSGEEDDDHYHHHRHLLKRGQPRGAPLTPPPSSASSLQSDGAPPAAQQMILSRVLDNYKLYDMLQQQQQQQMC